MSRKEDHEDVVESLDVWIRHGIITEWHYANARYVVEGVPYTLPQALAFTHALGKACAWVERIAVEAKGEEWVDSKIEEVERRSNPAAEAALIDVLTYHQRVADSGCACGWGEWGHSYARHVADVYRMELAHLQSS